MRRRALLAAAWFGGSAMFCVSIASAQVGLIALDNAAPLDEGPGYYRRCVQFDPSQDKIDAERAVACSLFLDGLDQGIRAVVNLFNGNLPPCIPKNVTLTQQSDVFESWLKANPNRITGETVHLYLAALLEAYPCKKPATPAEKKF